ncbi:hypothetical protein [Snodgrassella alvi]|nr:hypothetical protein [Snodgrassella alvi]
MWIQENSTQYVYGDFQNYQSRDHYVTKQVGNVVMTNWVAALEFAV